VRVPVASHEDKLLHRTVRRADGTPFEFNGMTMIPEWRRETYSDMSSRFETGRFSMRDIQLLLWGMLEGGRRKFTPDAKPITVEGAGDIIDSAGQQLVEQMISILRSAMPDADSVEAGEKKTETETKTESDAESSGESYSTSPSESGSAKTTSGI
jgi:hypothetical protein